MMVAIIIRSDKNVLIVLSTRARYDNFDENIHRLDKKGVY